MTKLFKASALFLMLIGTSVSVSAQDLIDWGVRVQGEKTKTKVDVTTSQVNVYNTYGEVVLSRKVIGTPMTSQLNFPELRSGSYLIVVQYADVQKVVKFIKK